MLNPLLLNFTNFILMEREDHAGAIVTHVNFLQPFCLHNARGHKGGRDEKERRRGGNDWWTISHRRINWLF